MDILTSHDVEVSVIFNGYPTNKTWTLKGVPSLAQVINHDVDEVVLGGTEVFSSRAAGGAADTTGKRITSTTTYPLENHQWGERCIPKWPRQASNSYCALIISLPT